MECQQVVGNNIGTPIPILKKLFISNLNTLATREQLKEFLGSLKSEYLKPNSRLNMAESGAYLEIPIPLHEEYLKLDGVELEGAEISIREHAVEEEENNVSVVINARSPKKVGGRTTPRPKRMAKNNDKGEKCDKDMEEVICRYRIYK